MIKSSIATEKTDRKIQQREWTKGRDANIRGLAESDCPWHGGLTEQWWKDGFNNRNFPVGIIRAQ